MLTPPGSVDQPGRVVDCRQNEFSCDSGDRVGTHGADDGYCEVSSSLDQVRACFIDRCWSALGPASVATANGGACRAGSTLSTSGAGGGFAACCSPWSSTTANINEWMNLECSIAHVHAAESWVTLATFGPHGIDSYEALHQAGFIMHNTDDYQICGLGDSCAGWCVVEPSGCTAFAAIPIATC